MFLTKLQQKSWNLMKQQKNLDINPKAESFVYYFTSIIMIYKIKANKNN